jgi:transposase
MLDDLRRRNYSPDTIRGYIRAVQQFAEYFGRSPEQMGAEELRRYQIHLLHERKLALGTVENNISALRFLYRKTLKRRDLAFDDLPFPKQPRMRNLIDGLWSEWKLVEQQIEELNDELERISAADAGCTRIRQIPGIGPVVATAIVAAIGNGAAFRKGREFAAWLGIVPRQYSTGGKAKLFGISKRGNAYLRRILIHGARAAVLHIKRDRAPIGAWLDALDARAPKNVVVVAMANKLARIAWAVLSSGNEYRPAAA